MDSPLLSVDRLATLLGAGPAPVVLDVRWELAGGARRDLYEQGHIPGGRFIDLEAELAGPPGRGGRHPLPAPQDFTAAMRRAGVSPRRPVVVYDAGPATAAARAWWLLRYFGHPAVTVLNGGLAVWVKSGRGLEPGSPPDGPEGDFTAVPGGMPVLDADRAAELAVSGVLLDARASERFRGESEPVDPVAGHIPGARSRPTTLNVDGSGRFRAADQLHAEFRHLGVDDRIAVGAYCGSGISAAHQVLALELAGYRAALYPGSWSEWITDPQRPVATGG
ncbi:MAG TPA: sulfurtransferase [Solirubrobacteraceae bacterium]